MSLRTLFNNLIPLAPGPVLMTAALTLLGTYTYVLNTNLLQPGPITMYGDPQERKARYLANMELNRREMMGQDAEEMDKVLEIIEKRKTKRKPRKSFVAVEELNLNQEKDVISASLTSKAEADSAK